MSASITGHDVIEITAEAASHLDANWVDFTASLRGGGELAVNLFFRGQLAAEKVCIYAKHMAAANEEIAALQLPVEAPSVVAKRCCVIVEADI